MAVIGGLLGAVTLGALAGARRTDSAYSRYLRSVNASDVLVDVPGPLLPAVRDIEHEPGTLSSAAWIGLNANPVIDGKVDSSFLTDAMTGSLDGEFYRQDKVTVLAGRLPPPDATDELMLTPGMASTFGLTVGSHMTWQFYRVPANAQGVPANAPAVAAQRVTFGVAAIVNVSPALVDQFDQTPTAILPPGATMRFLHGEWAFGWAALRLRDGDAGVRALRGELASLGKRLTSRYGSLSFTIRRLAIVQHEAQQAIEPQALALAILGGLAALALLILMAQALAQLVSRSAADAATLRAMGASRTDAAAAVAMWGCVAVAGAILLAVAGAIAASPLAPVGPVRAYDPARGVRADWVVLGAGGAALLVVLTAELAWLAWRAVRQSSETTPERPSALVGVARRTGLPVTIVTGIRHALERSSGRARAPVRATLMGSVVAVVALVAALVFGASLTGLVSHPAQYGWNWNLLIQSEGGWGSWPPGALDSTVARQPGVTGWSELGFAQVTIRNTEVPAMGVLPHAGVQVVEPPTTSGHALSGPNQIELGSVTMRQLGLHLGDEIRLGRDRHPVTVVGTVTLPSFGVVLTDHVSLGRGAMLGYSTLMAVLGLNPDPPASQENGLASPAYPATAVFDLRSRADATALTARILTLGRENGESGGIYPLPPQRGAAVINAGQLGSQPLVLASGVACAAVLALALTILASVRQRRRDLALLKALGLRARQVRAVIAWQTTTILVAAAVAGIPLGIAAGRWAWVSFASSIGVVPASVIPRLALVVGIGAVLLAGNLLATWPAQIAARVAPAATFRME